MANPMTTPRKGELEVPASAVQRPCSTCGMPIVLAPTKAGKFMPLSLTTGVHRDGVLYALPHWADCPSAAKHRPPPAVKDDHPS